MNNNEFEFLIKVNFNSWTINEVMKKVDTIREKYPNAKIRVEAEM